MSESILAFLRDSVWQFVGALIALLAIPAAYWIYLLQRKRKELSFGVLSHRRLLSISDELSSRVTVSLDGSPVGNVHLIVIGVKNSGNQPILEGDFVRPFRVIFGAETKLLSADVVKQTPSNLGASFNIDPAFLQLSPLLLNPGDYFVVQLLISAPELKVSADARIVGVPNLQALRKSQSRIVGYDFHTIISNLAMMATALSAIIAVQVTMYSIDKYWLNASAIIFVVAFFVYLAAKRLRRNYGSESRRYIDDT